MKIAFIKQFISVKKTRGQLLIELLIAIGISVVIIPALLTGFISSRQGKVQQDQRLQAVTQLEEAKEAVRQYRENGWTGFAIDGTYNPQIVGNAWILASGAATVNGFTRKIVIGDVYRNNSGTIVAQGSPGATYDPSTKIVSTTISWASPYASSVQDIGYVTRYLDNLSFTHTTIADFTPGTATGTAVVAQTGTGVLNDGQVQLGAGGGGDWCNPGNSVVKTFDLPGQGVVQAISATSSAAQDVAYTTTGGNASGDSVDGLTISHASPPVIANPSSNTEAKAYGIFVDNTNSYVYFNENNPPSHTVRIAQTSNLAGVGYFDVSHGTGNSIFVSGNTGFTTVGSTLYSFDVSSKTGSRPQLGSVSLAGNGQRVVVIGTNAYVATSSTTSQLQIINVSNPSSMSVTKSINVGNGLGGVDVYVNSTQTYAYLVTSYISGQSDFYIIDLTNTINIWGYTTINSMNPKGVITVPGNKAIIVGSGGEQYEVFDITHPNAASHCGGLSPSGVNTISAVAPVIQANGNAFSYIVTDNASAEFQIIQGGPGGQFSTSGTFESATFDANLSAEFNYFNANISQPSSTTIKTQVAVAPSVGGSCTTATFNYVGPSGSSSAYFTPVGNTISGAIPFGTYGSYQNPNRCFRYKFYFDSSDPSQTPILQDITVNYSP